MNILLVATHWPGNPARLVARGFEQAGHIVHSFGPYVSGDWKPTSEYIVPTWADLIVETDQAIYYKYPCSAPHVLYATDVIARGSGYYAYRDSIKLSHEFYVDSRNCYGRKNARFLPCAYDPELHKPGLPYRERTIPVACYGSLDGGRQEVVDAVSKVAEVATGYTDFGGYVLAYQNTKISLCHSRAGGNIDQRFFESMAMGCCVVSDRKPSTQSMGCLTGAHYLEYRDSEDAMRLVKALSSMEVAPDLMAKRAMEWVKPHTWKARSETIINKVFGG